MSRDCDGCELTVSGRIWCVDFWKAMGLKIHQNVPSLCDIGWKDNCWHPVGTILVVDEKPE